MAQIGLALAPLATLMMFLRHPSEPNVISSFWSLPVRAGPVIAGFLSFAVVNAVRRFFRLQYTPSYFVIFPVSLLDRDVARFTGHGPGGRPKTDEERRSLKRSLLAKTVGAAVITFVLIPLSLGIIAASYMRASEFAVTLLLLLVWQGYAAYQSITDNTRYSDKPRASAQFFAVFYAVYLASVGGFMHQGYAFAHPYLVTGNWGGLLAAAWNMAFLTLIAGSAVAVLANLMTYFITERDVI